MYQVVLGAIGDVDGRIVIVRSVTTERKYKNKHTRGGEPGRPDVKQGEKEK